MLLGDFHSANGASQAVRRSLTSVVDLAVSLRRAASQLRRSGMALTNWSLLTRDACSNEGRLEPGTEKHQ